MADPDDVDAEPSLTPNDCPRNHSSSCQATPGERPGACRTALIRKLTSVSSRRGVSPAVSICSTTAKHCSSAPAYNAPLTPPPPHPRSHIVVQPCGAHTPAVSPSAEGLGI